MHAYVSVCLLVHLCIHGDFASLNLMFCVLLQMCIHV